MTRKVDKHGRSKGESRHVRLYHYLLLSPAWRALRAVERAIYVELASRYAGQGSNNGKIPYAIRDGADALAISKATVSRALLRLQETGFIVCTTKGGFNRKTRHATEWRLTEFPCDVTSTLPTKDFMRWSEEGSKKQNTVPLMKLTVPVVKPFGPSHETVTPKNDADGPSHETVEANSDPSTVSPEGHLYVYQGDPASRHAQQQGRSRSAPTGSAEASDRPAKVNNTSFADGVAALRFAFEGDPTLTALLDGLSEDIIKKAARLLDIRGPQSAADWLCKHKETAA